MQVSNMPDTCTGRHFCGFPNGWSYYEELVKQHPRYEATYTPKWYEENTLAPLRKELREQLNRAKNERIVCVFAFLIGPQEGIGDLLVKEFGFVRTFDAHNFKYPDSSKRLFMYTRDMNDWVHQVERVKENPFAQPAQPTPPPAPVAAATVQVVVDDTPTICDERTSVHRTRVRTLRGTARVYSTSRLMATQEGNMWRARLGARLAEHPFPANEWVAIPNELETIPPTLLRQRVDVLLSNGRVFPWHWLDWTQRRNGQDVVAVKRIVA